MSTTISPPNTNNPINLETIQNDFFREAIEQYVLAYREHFGDRLITIYAWGSVPRGEAIPGISDIDLHPFISDELTEADLQWWEQTDARLKAAYPKTNGLSKPRPVTYFSDGLKPDASEHIRTRTESYIIRFHYDSILIYGRDLIKSFNITIPKTCGNIDSHRQLIRYTAGLETENKTDYRLPTNPTLRLRKLARIGVWGGAEFLKAQGEFLSYKGDDILPTLKTTLPEWTPFLAKTQDIYIKPTEPSDQEISDYLASLLKWMDWLNTKMDN